MLMSEKKLRKNRDKNLCANGTWYLEGGVSAKEARTGEEAFDPAEGPCPDAPARPDSTACPDAPACPDSTACPDAPVLRVRDLTKRYDGRPVVDEVSLDIPRGKVVSFIGPNGAGKSTVMGMISRLLPRDGGTVELEGRDLGAWKDKELSKRLAILTQSNNVQMKLTVRELVGFGRFPYSGSHLTAEDERRVDEAIGYMELGDYQDRFIDELSGGQRQRAYIAMVIAQDTELVLLDEPTNNLDIYHATNLMKTVRRLCDELGKTVVLVLHEINYAAFYSDFICAFVDGRIASYGTVEEVMTSENLGRIYGVDFQIIQVEGKPLSIYY